MALLAEFTKKALEPLQGETTDHLGYERRRAGDDGGDSRALRQVANWPPTR